MQILLKEYRLWTFHSTYTGVNNCNMTEIIMQMQPGERSLYTLTSDGSLEMSLFFSDNCTDCTVLDKLNHFLWKPLVFILQSQHHLKISLLRTQWSTPIISDL